ncbi:hypothetical protein FB446DRAFT_706780 [Lentinula raphanica]|nr:hypothetical protein FB446DRAFT_706780 [Lentinula raphanica]
MNTSDASTTPRKRQKTPEPSDRVLRPRKRARVNYVEVKTKVVRPSARQGRVPAHFRRVRGPFAFLEKLITVVPIEIVYLKIFAYLDTRDLLMLSRSCHLLRSILFTKCQLVEDMWRAARFNVKGNLPPLPKDLNEPQYARLIHDLECHLCNKPSKGNMILWKFRLRCCRDCVQSFRIFRRRHFSEELHPFTSFDILTTETVRGKDHDDIIVDFDQAKELRAQFMALRSAEDRRLWLIQKREDREAIVQHAHLCEAWHEDQLAQRATQLTALCTERLNAILTRLEAHGLRRDAELILDGKSGFRRPHELSHLSCVNLPKALTDGGWARIKSKLFELLIDHRTRRLAQENYLRLREEYYDLLSHQDLRDIYPGLGDVLTDPAIEATIWDKDLQEALTPASLRTLLAEFLSQFLDNWRHAKIEELLEVLRKARPCANTGDLRLATTIFHCAACNALLLCPQVFYHRCCLKTCARDPRSHDRMQVLNGHYNTIDQEGPWSSTSLFFHAPSSQLAEKIVIGAGLDPSTATVGDLTRAQPVIQCTSFHAEYFPERLFVTWPTALFLNLTVNNGDFFNINNFELPPQKLLHHYHEVHDMNLLLPSTDSREFYKLHDSHWYWNPRENLHSIGTDFRLD